MFISEQAREIFGKIVIGTDNITSLCCTLSSFPLILLSWTRKSLSSALVRAKSVSIKDVSSPLAVGFSYYSEGTPSGQQ
jgi:hypothetical protein